MSAEEDEQPWRRPGDLSPVVEEFASTRRIVRWVSEADVPGRPDAASYAPEDIHDFRPGLRPPVPVLTVLDDGSLDDGEDFRLRRERCAIGRTAGDVTVSHDAAVSANHAEIRRTPWKGGFQWHLQDLGSVNGTFVRCVRAVLHEHAILILGARRFRLRNPLRSDSVPTASLETNELDGHALPRAVWPVLTEASGKASAVEVSLRADKLTIGRTGGGADIELDDPLLAHRHATLRRLRDGTWLMSAEATRNGTWVSVTAVALTSYCFFRCGEQRFRFVVP